jgi:hypothetical protein
MDQQDEVSQEVMDVDPLVLESIDDFDAFLELEEGEATATSNAIMMSHIMEGCEDFEVKVNEKGILTVTFKKQMDGKYKCMAKVGQKNKMLNKRESKGNQGMHQEARFSKELYRRILIFKS